MPERFDVIVVGLGGHGAAALYHLAKRGAKVLGIERYSIAHDRGSSHGESRIIRLAYHEHPDYVPLLKRAWTLWKELEADSGEDLFRETGCLETCHPDFNGGENCFRHSLEAAQTHGLRHEILNGGEVNRRFPGYDLPPEFRAVLADGGILASERCISTHVARAEAHGASVRTGERVLRWHAERRGGDVTIVTNKGRYTAAKAVFAAGSWMGQLVPELSENLTVERQVIGWFEVLKDGCCRPESFPVCVIEGPVGSFYAFPQFEQPGMKIGKFNHLRERVDPPETLQCRIASRDEKALRDGVQEWFPAANGRLLSAAACMFTNSPDKHFILDAHPLHPQVTICSACSGHGFKFCSVIGEILADLVLEGQTKLDIQLHRLSSSRQGHPELLQRFRKGAAAGVAKL